ncbi:Asp23/Gls24 family envelope stress response protein [Gordonia sp. CPCC 206044]|uniref:Asp23/Gls24 family envelope stress response protein n=1 Tax=Gordonia sp. CPCC 206044 TaxID=3140793 RepID=UPI003AF3D808
MAESATVARGVGSVDPGPTGTVVASSDGPAGALVIADRVGEKIAARAALDIDGVVEYQGSIGSLLGGSTPGRALVGGDYPNAKVAMSESAPRVSVNIALSWPCAVAEVCQQVRAHVAGELARLAGIRPSRVDVAVSQIVPRAQAARRNKGFIEIAGPDGEPGEES